MSTQHFGNNNLSLSLPDKAGAEVSTGRIPTESEAKRSLKIRQTEGEVLLCICTGGEKKEEEEEGEEEEEEEEEEEGRGYTSTSTHTYNYKYTQLLILYSTLQLFIHTHFASFVGNTNFAKFFFKS